MQSVRGRFCGLRILICYSVLVNPKGIIRTESVPEFGGLTIPLVIASQIWGTGGTSSVHRTVKRGESHRTIEEGSSNLNMRFSNLAHAHQRGVDNQSINTYVSGAYLYSPSRALFHDLHRSCVATTKTYPHISNTVNRDDKGGHSLCRYEVSFPSQRSTFGNEIP